MGLTSREHWVLTHGLFLGTLFLLVCGGSLVALWTLRPGLNTSEGVQGRMKLLRVGLGATAAIAWALVITGTWIIYPWYRVKLAGAKFDKCAGLELPSSACSSRDFLLSNVAGETEMWHKFGMEWKEHLAWGAPFLATSALLLTLFYGPRIIARPWLRNVLIVMLVSALVAVVLAGGLGAAIGKVAPVS